MRNFVAAGGPLNGFDFEENCRNSEDDDTGNIRCEIQDKMNAFSMLSPYSPVVQAVIGPSNYLRDHKKQNEYLEHSTFLPYINNEIDHSKRKSNKKRFESLNYITMVKFLKDPIIYPKESSWFG